jgi:hypothetical protein
MGGESSSRHRPGLPFGALSADALSDKVKPVAASMVSWVLGQDWLSQDMIV